MTGHSSIVKGLLKLLSPTQSKKLIETLFKTQSGIISDNVTAISWEAFSDNETIKSVTIPESVTSIGYGAFSGCVNLADVKLPANVIDIGVDAFISQLMRFLTVKISKAFKFL